MTQQTYHFLTFQNRKTRWLWLSLPLWVFLFVMTELNLQANDKEQEFYQKISEIRQDYRIEEQNIRSLISAISQQYSGQLVKSAQNIDIFAQGIISNHPNINTIGLAEFIAKSQQKAFENQQKRNGFESFNIRGKGLFQQEQSNELDHVLAISHLEPMTPQSSILLAEDLFTLPQVTDQFNHWSKQNLSGYVWLSQNHPKKTLAFALHPFYATEPSLLTETQRMNWVQGLMLFEIDIESHLFAPIAATFKDQSINSTLHIPSLQQTIKRGSDIANDYGAFNHWLEFTTYININHDCANCRLRIQQSLGWQHIKVQPLLWAALLGLLLFIALSTLILYLTSKTQTLADMHNRMQEILNASRDAIIITDQTGHVKVWNPSAEKLFGYRFAEVEHQSLTQLIFDKHSLETTFGYRGSLLDLFTLSPSELRRRTQALKVEAFLLTKTKKQILAEVTHSVLIVNGEPEISLFIKDITAQRKTEEEIHQYAFYDALTQLENRVFFKSQIEKQLTASPETNFAILFMDLDGFKQVNDSLGHDIGDELLKVVAKRLTHNLKGVGEKSHICRFGGDEFVLMLSGASYDNVESIALRILGYIQRTIKINQHELNISASIGIAFYPSHGNTVDSLLRHADTAMYEAKAFGKNTYAIYQEHMTRHISARLQMEKHLRNALSKNEFFLVFQPQMEFKSGKIIGMEALLRWRNPVLGHVPPNVFIPIAEETRMILDISEWVIQQTIKQLQHWQSTPYKELSIAVNISSHQFSRDDFISHLAKNMQQANLPNRLLEIELTESTIMTNADENIKRLVELREQGFNLAIDDFGTGYSSLSYLKRFPINILKIDKSFIDGLPHDEEDISISQSILGLAHSLGLEVVAEGVENLEQLHFLEEQECDYIQGYVVSRPIESERLDLWLQEHAENFYHSDRYLSLIK